MKSNDTRRSRRFGEFDKRVLITGFGPFPGANENPTEGLVRSLSVEPRDTLGSPELKAIVLPTDYRRTWKKLWRVYRSYAPDVVLHFGLSGRATSLAVETVGRRACSKDKADTSGYAPRSGFAVRVGPEALAVTLDAAGIVAALRDGGFDAALSADAGGYVCNATLYRSLLAAPPGRRVGFIHVPPPTILSPSDLERAAKLVIRTATRSAQPGHVSDSR